MGDWVDRFPESVKALHEAGHEIMNHSNAHHNMTRLSKEDIVADLNEANDKIEKITGRRPTLFRPPYGAYNNTLIDAVKSLNMLTVQWDVDSLDWKDYSADKIFNIVKSKTRPGSIALFHNAAKNTPAALPMIIEWLLSEGYKIVPVSEIIHTNNFTLNHEGRQIPNG